MPVEVTPQKGEIEELAEKAETFNYKATGIFNAAYWESLDKTAAGSSSYYNFFVKQNGEPYGYYKDRGALKPLDFDKVLEFTEKKIAELAEQILSGSIGVHPYRLGTSSACTYCKYRPVCRFDWQINDYNPLETVSKIAFLETAGRADG
jgi:ATP-dependent helicase/DNAse subunit B